MKNTKMYGVSDTGGVSFIKQGKGTPLFSNQKSKAITVIGREGP
jgi:hypothetical protein